MTSRLFLALEIPDSVLERIIEVRDSVYGGGGGIRWEPKEKLHITLKFLGDTDNSIIPSLEKSISSVLEGKNSFGLVLSRFGMFYRDKKPAILWLGTNKNLALQELFLELDNAVSAFGFKKEEREFKPHLTLLRIKGNENLNKLKEITEQPPVDLEFKAERIILFRSKLLSSGSVYEEVKSFLLK